MGTPIVGAQLFTLRAFTQTPVEIRRTLQRVREIGYTAVQLSGLGPMDARELGQALRATDLSVAATHTAWTRFLSDLDSVVEEHKVWNCRHPAIGGLPKEYFSEPGLARFCGELEKVTERLNAEGMDFSYHNHNHELARCGNETWLGMLYDRTDPAKLKAELDTYWVQAGGGDPAQWIDRCAGREPLLHVKDMRVTPEREQRFAEIGEGNLNWPAILTAAEAGGVEYLLVEQDACYDRDPFDALALSYRNLSRMGYR